MDGCLRFFSSLGSARCHREGISLISHLRHTAVAVNPFLCCAANQREDSKGEGLNCVVSDREQTEGMDQGPGALYCKIKTSKDVH